MDYRVGSYCYILLTTQQPTKRTKIMPTIPHVELRDYLAKRPKKKASAKNSKNLPFPDYPGYESLISVLNMALNQCAAGKGKERHAQGQPFDKQPMQVISQLLNSPEGMRYQVVKKTQESSRMEKDPAIQELLGAIIYAAGTVIFLQNKE